MRLYYNPDIIFKGIEPNKVLKYKKRLLELAKTLEEEGMLSNKVIDQFKFKKMKGTKNIFKFYLDNSDGFRCLTKYEEKDDQIFSSGLGLILIKAVSHDTQGTIGKLFDEKYIQYERFLLNDEETTGDEDDFGDFFGKQYLRTYVYHNDISDEEFLNDLEQTNLRTLPKLSKKQLESMNQDGPVFLMGSAGSGKTLVEVSKALKNSFNDIKQVYFTYTHLLKDSAYKLYDKYAKSERSIGKTEFHIIREFFLNNLDLNYSNYMNFERFLKWFNNRKFNSRERLLTKIDPIDIWTEIRGLIKGYTGHDYYRILTFKFEPKVMNKEIIDYLEALGYVQKEKNSNSRFIIRNAIALYDEIYTNYPNFHRYLILQDLENAYLDEYTYVSSMYEKYTRFDNAQRKEIFDFVKYEYQPYLDKNNLYDDNDLARMLLKKIYEKEITIKYDQIYIDEVQDLTEMQIFTLSKLVKDPQNIFMSGDVSQVINPTFFFNGRLGVIFRNHFSCKINDSKKLTENYRNSENIVKVLEELLKVRRETIGKYDYDIEEESAQLEKKEGLPIFLHTDEEEMIEIFRGWIDVPNVAIIVANDDVKLEIKNRLKIKNDTNLYTVSEIKGQEFNKIITYNIVSEFEKSWQAIMQNKIKKGSEQALQFRYYFNLLYVALTRGRINLYMYEKNTELEIIKRLLPLFEEVRENLDDILNISVYDTEENRQKQAKSYMEQRDYRRAYSLYLKLNDKKMATIAKGLSELESGDIESGLIKLYKEKQYYNHCYQFTSKKHLLFHILFGAKSGNLRTDDIINLLNGKKLMDLYVKASKRVKEITYKDVLVLITNIGKTETSKKINKILETI